jgi:uncharacterized protein with von Willebrand factor type A (vWA) domain
VPINNHAAEVAAAATDGGDEEDFAGAGIRLLQVGDVEQFRGCVRVSALAVAGLHVSGATTCFVRYFELNWDAIEDLRPRDLPRITNLRIRLRLPRTSSRRLRRRIRRSRGPCDWARSQRHRCRPLSGPCRWQLDWTRCFEMVSSHRRHLRGTIRDLRGI